MVYHGTHQGKNKGGHGKSKMSNAAVLFQKQKRLLGGHWAQQLRWHRHAQVQPPLHVPLLRHMRLACRRRQRVIDQSKRLVCNCACRGRGAARGQGGLVLLVLLVTGRRSVVSGVGRGVGEFEASTGWLWYKNK